MTVPLHIHLLTYHKKDLADFRIALDSYPLPSSFTISYHTGSLQQLPAKVQFDLAVSPANSHGYMDGGFDDALSKEFSPKGDYLALTRVVQRKLWQEWRGFAPPGTCTLVPFDFNTQAISESEGSSGSTAVGNTRRCRMIAVCPTMRVPDSATWDREVVYECIWSLLCAVDKWNRGCTQEEKINSLLMTPLATGVGGVSAWKWASQALLAMRHFEAACSNEDRREGMSWDSILDLNVEIEATHTM